MSRAQNEYVPALYEPVFALDEYVTALLEHVFALVEHVTMVSPHNVNVHRAAAKDMQAEKAARPAAPCATYCYHAVCHYVTSFAMLAVVHATASE